MFPDERYIKIAKGLLEKTRERKVPWNSWTERERESEASRLNLSFKMQRQLEHTAFLFRLPNTNVRLAFLSPPAGNGIVSLRILDKYDHLAGSWSVEEGQDHWPLAFELYLEVSKQVTNWDKVLEEIEEFIGKH